MSDPVPAPPGAPDPDPGAAPGAAPPPKARKRFILLGTGIGLVLVLIVGLFTSIGAHSNPGGTVSSTGNGGGAPSAGDRVPAFSAPNLQTHGPRTVSVSPSDHTPTVLLFFGAWCPSCHQELPPLAAAVTAQTKSTGDLGGIRVVGVDSEDKTSSAQAFMKSAAVTFPVAYDPNTTITNTDFWFTGDPYAVFVKADGTIDKIVRGDVLTPAALMADEQALLTPSGT